MNKIKNIFTLLIFQLFICFAFFPIISEAQIFTKIVDSTNLDLKQINSIGVKTGGKAEFPIGSVIVWYHDYDPADNNCTSAKTGGDGKGGKCKWIECNGQEINLDVYIEYATSFPEEYQYSTSTWRPTGAYIKNTPNYQNKFAAQKSGNSSNGSLKEFGLYHLYLSRYSYPLEYHGKHLHYDGLIDVEVSGLDTNGVMTYQSRMTAEIDQTKYYIDENGNGKLDAEEKREDNRKHRYPIDYTKYQTKEWETEGYVDQIISVRYLMRVSN